MTAEPINEFAGCAAAALAEVLARRDERASRQKELLAAHCGRALVSLTLNIAGEYKAFPLASRCFREGERVLAAALEAENILIVHRESSESRAGYCAFIVADAAPDRVKTLALGIEKNHALGRIFDIDVLGPDGEKLSRLNTGDSPRPCFVCGANAFACARGRVHAPEEVTRAMLAIMNAWLRQALSGRVRAAALRALMGEVATTPKPGLVDRQNSGSHRDMDFFSFIDSAAAILPYFTECAVIGFDSASSPRELFDSLRHGGRLAERRMLAAAGGVNVHKGIIFSFGVLAAAYGKLFKAKERPSLEDTLELCRDMTSRLFDDFAKVNTQNAKTAGERFYARYGITGIRGEVAEGFPHVIRRALPVFRRMLKDGHTVNDSGAAALLCLIAHVDDTNIISRRGIETARRVKNEMAAFLETEPCMEDILRMARDTDARFIENNISAGGCADLLAVTYFLYYLFWEDAPAASRQESTEKEFTRGHGETPEISIYFGS